MEIFREIRRTYNAHMPEIKEQWESGSRHNIDPYFFNWKFTPIEWAAWQDIRGFGLPMFPQLPVGKYFVDFGNPFIKLAIECDGKQWHDREKDNKRDQKLIADGWTIYRIPGDVCKRVLPAPWETEKDQREGDEYMNKANKWFTTTCTGLVYAIKHKHFSNDEENVWCSKFNDAYNQTLTFYRSYGI